MLNMSCKKCNCSDKNEYVTKFIDINGAEIMFKVMKEQLSLQKKDLLQRIKENNNDIKRIDKKVRHLDENVYDLQDVISKIKKALKNNVYTKEDINNNFYTKDEIHENYYNKYDVDNKIKNPDIIEEEEIKLSFSMNQ